LDGKKVPWVDYIKDSSDSTRWPTSNLIALINAENGVKASNKRLRELQKEAEEEDDEIPIDEPKKRQTRSRSRRKTK
jgi:hypothetical protein